MFRLRTVSTSKGIINNNLISFHRKYITYGIGSFHFRKLGKKIPKYFVVNFEINGELNLKTHWQQDKFGYLIATPRISAKFSCCNAGVRFAFVGVKPENRAIDIRGALKSYDFCKHERAEIYYSHFISPKFSYSKERVRFLKKGSEQNYPTKRISSATNAFSNMSRRKSGSFNTYGLLIVNELILIKKQWFRLFFEVAFGMVRKHLKSI